MNRSARILVVDDETAIQRALGPLLRTRGYDVDLAASGLNIDDETFCRRAVTEAGVAVIPVSAFYASNPVRNVVRLLKRSDSLAPCQEHLIPLDDYYNLVGLKDLLAREESYDKAAAALVQKRAAE